MIYDLIVFLPLLGFLDRRPVRPRRSAPRIPSSSRRACSASRALLAWIAFFIVAFGSGEAFSRPGRQLDDLGQAAVAWALRFDTLTGGHAGRRHHRLGPRAHLFDRLHGATTRSRPRFFAYLSLFTFAMLMLVTADNLVQMFFGWEGVGLASYLLIGFWYEQPSANAAAIKAFVVNRVGDFGFALGIFLVFALTGSVSFDRCSPRRPGSLGKTIHVFGIEVDALTITCLLLFMGAMGKSAQFLLHTWLPDAMEGPTPVSALIHAATMVTAGVFMVARLSPLFDLCAGRAQRRHRRRRHDRVLRGDGRPGAERHQARHRLFDLLAARLHVLRRRRRRLQRSASSTCSPTPSSRRCCSWARARSSTPCITSRTCARWAACEGRDSLHLLDDDDRHAGADRRRHSLHDVGFAGYVSKDAIIEAAYASHAPRRGLCLRLRRARGGASPRSIPGGSCS